MKVSIGMEEVSSKSLAQFGVIKSEAEQKFCPILF